MFYDKITICHSAVKVSCLVCYTIILKLHIIDSKKEAHVSGNLFMPHSSPLRAKFAKFPFIPYVCDLSYICVHGYLFSVLYAYIHKYMHTQYTLHACHMYIRTCTHMQC